LAIYDSHFAQKSSCFHNPKDNGFAAEFGEDLNLTRQYHTNNTTAGMSGISPRRGLLKKNPGSKPDGLLPVE
jgi:hypothetical protein